MMMMMMMMMMVYDDGCGFAVVGDGCRQHNAASSDAGQDVTQRDGHHHTGQHQRLNSIHSFYTVLAVQQVRS